GLGMRSALFIAFHVERRPAGLLVLARAEERGPWAVNVQLLLKLLGTSLATGLERDRVGRRLANHEAREALSEAAANDGLWDFDVERNSLYLSPRWKAMLGYDQSGPSGPVDWRGLVHPDDMTRVQEAIRNHLSGAAPLFDSV